MKVYTLLVTLGMPTLFALITALFAYFKKLFRSVEILKTAVQNQMRASLLRDGKQYLKDGSITELELFDWKARYEAYHALGKNGVLNALNEEIINLAIHSN